ncbi:hypothetical protein RND81_13G098600 [Saponaria officinalis]|uniref:Transducin/WD40 repeat-like superfamily protein n=1 Tax=Saponaria officinalis TaxID=3572 RepID=A0AAW1GVZ3_SAPOF
MSLLAGSYESFIWGYKLKHLKTATTTTAETLNLTLAPQFSYAAHFSPIKSITVSGTVAASSAGDDTVKLYDLTTSTELGSVLLYSSSATSLSLFGASFFPTNLIAGATTGDVHIFDIDPFVLLKTVKVHKKSVNDVAVHPSGRVALTVARDLRLSMVNLVRGKRSYYSRLENEVDVVKYFGDGGDKFFTCSGDNVCVHNSEDARLIAEFENSKRILCAAPAHNGLIFTSGEDRGITVWDSVAGKVAYQIEDTHKTRVKGIVVLSRDGNSSSAESPFLVGSASSDGVIRVWDVRATSKGKSVPLSEADTKSRLTCLAGTSITSLKQPQTKKDVSENNAEEMGGA